MKFYNLIIMFAMLLGSTIACASNVPSVSQIESTIASGDYTEARKQLGEVLKENPDSYVANRYMFEIVKIENGRDDTPSVDYKIYEDRLTQITKATEKRLAEEARKVQEAKDAERRKAFHSMLINFLIFAALGGIGFFIFIKIKEKSDIKKAEQKRLDLKQQADAQFIKWKDGVNIDLIDIANALERAAIKPASSKMNEELVGDYNLDNIDIIERIKDRDVNQAKVNAHIRECKQFLNENFGENL